MTAVLGSQTGGADVIGELGRQVGHRDEARFAGVDLGRVDAEMGGPRLLVGSVDASHHDCDRGDAWVPISERGVATGQPFDQRHHVGACRRVEFELIGHDTIMSSRSTPSSRRHTRLAIWRTLAGVVLCQAATE